MESIGVAVGSVTVHGFHQGDVGDEHVACRDRRRLVANLVRGRGRRYSVVTCPTLVGVLAVAQQRLERLDRKGRATLRRLQHNPAFRFLSTGLTLFGQRRIMGLSAEGAFWATFTLPWVVLGVVSATSGVAQWLGKDVTEQVRTSIIDSASQVLTAEAIDTTVVPLLDSIQAGSTGLSILGFVVALWSGSRVFATFVQGSEILNGYEPRGFVLTRAIALGIYVLALVTLGVVVFTIVQFPDFWANVVGLVPGPTSVWAVVIAGLGLVVTLTTVLYLADPSGTVWRFHLPGAVLALAVWVVASSGLSWYFQTVFQQESLYGAIGAPIAIMLWLYVSVLALFVGMTFTAALRLAYRQEYLDPLEKVSLPRAVADDFTTGMGPDRFDGSGPQWPRDPAAPHENSAADGAP